MNHAINPVPEPYGEILDRIYQHKDSFVEVNPGASIMPTPYALIAEDIFNFEVRSDDVWMVNYPRSGSTWCLEMLWLMKNNFDFDLAKKKMQQNRIPLFETTAVFYEKQHLFEFMDGYDNSIKSIDDMPSPRLIRTHLPVGLLPANLEEIKPKIIYVARNPKDVCVSLYHHFSLFHDLNTTMEEFCELFLIGKIPMSPIFQHILTYWKKRDEPNILFLKYEEMRQSIEATVEKVANFLEVEMTKEQKEALLDHLSFQNMKNNKACTMEFLIEDKIEKKVEEETGGGLIRKGEIGDWKNHMSEEISKRFDEFIEDNIRGTGLTFTAKNNNN